jgi:hypothetical protein
MASDGSALWNESETAQYLGVSLKFLQADRAKPLERRRIPFVKLGRAVRYDPADVIAYKDRSKVGAGAA